MKNKYGSIINNKEYKREILKGTTTIGREKNPCSTNETFENARFKFTYAHSQTHTANFD